MFTFEPLAGKLNVDVVALDGARVKHDLDPSGSGERYVESTVDGGTQVAGRVVLDGKPLAGAMIDWACRRGQSPKPVIVSGPDGKFRLKQLPAGNDCMLMARPPGESIFWNRPGVGGFLGTQMRVRPGDEAILMALRTEKPGSVVIRFDGRPEGHRGSLRLDPEGDIQKHTPPRDTSVFDKTTVTIPNLRAGSYRLTADLSDAANLGPVDVAVVAGESTSVTLTVNALLHSSSPSANNPRSGRP